MSLARRTLLRRFVAGGLLANVPLTIQQALANGNKPLAPGLYRMSGTVTINGKTASEGMHVQPGDVVTTGTNSHAVYVVGQDAYLQRENSSVSLLGSTLTTGLRVLTGKLLSVFGKGAKTLHTTTATIGIRGTGCYIEAEPERTYFCLCYGQADIIPTHAPEKMRSIVTTHHDAPVWIARDTASAPFTPANVANHSDDELILLESLVGRSPPFINDGQPRKPY